MESFSDEAKICQRVFMSVGEMRARRRSAMVPSQQDICVPVCVCVHVCAAAKVVFISM